MNINFLGRLLIPALLLATLAVGATPKPTSQGQTTTVPFRLATGDLGVMLKDMKYETATTSPGQFEIEMKQGSYTFHPVVAVSSSGNKIWITLSLRPLGSLDMSNADFLSKLLIANNAVGPGQFYIENVADAKKPADYRLGFGYPLDNRGVTESVLRDSLDAFATSLAEQAAIWDTAKK